MKNDPKEKPEVIQSPGVDRERAIPPDFVPEPKLPAQPSEPQEPQAPGPDTSSTSTPH